MNEQDTYTLRVEGEQQLAKLNDLLREQRKLLSEAVEAQKQGKGLAKYDAEMAAEQIVTLKQQIAEAKTVMNPQDPRVQSGMQQMGGRFQARMMGQALAGVAAAPFEGGNAMGAAAGQLGFAGEMMAMQSGMGAGQFLAIATGLGLLREAVNHFTEISAWLKGVDVKQMEADAKALNKTLEDYKKIREAPTPEQAKQAGVAAGAMGAFGQGKLGAQLEAALGPQVQGLSPEERKKLENANLLQYFTGMGSYTDIKAADEAKRVENARNEAARIQTEAQKPGPAGDAARARLQQLGLGQALIHPDVSASGFVGPPGPEQLYKEPGSAGYLYPRGLPGMGGFIPPGGIDVPGAISAEARKARLERARDLEANTPLSARPARTLGEPDTEQELERVIGELDRMNAQAAAVGLDNSGERLIHQLQNRLMALQQNMDRFAANAGRNQAILQRANTVFGGIELRGNYPSMPSYW